MSLSESRRQEIREEEQERAKAQAEIQEAQRRKEERRERARREAIKEAEEHGKSGAFWRRFLTWLTWGFVLGVTGCTANMLSDTGYSSSETVDGFFGLLILFGGIGLWRALQITRWA